MISSMIIMKTKKI